MKGLGQWDRLFLTTWVSSIFLGGSKEVQSWKARSGVRNVFSGFCSSPKGLIKTLPWYYCVVIIQGPSGAGVKSDGILWCVGIGKANKAGSGQNCIVDNVIFMFYHKSFQYLRYLHQPPNARSRELLQTYIPLVILYKDQAPFLIDYYMHIFWGQ